MTNDNNDQDFQLSSYDYELPPELIANRPASHRDNSRLLIYRHLDDEIIHSNFFELVEFLPEGSLLVVNQSKVFPCRLLGTKSTGGKAEIFVLSLHAKSGDLYPCLIRTTTKKREGDLFYFDSLQAELIQKAEDGTFWVRFNTDDLVGTLEKSGMVPIPPYIRNGVSDEKDRSDYQTVYAKEVGSVAAPTAGLHFTSQVFEKLKEKNIDIARVTLHVGMGTFAKVQTDDIRDHQMHTELFTVDQENIDKIKSGRKIFAVGTTSLRVLESCTDIQGNFEMEAGELRETNIFLYPGKEVRSISGLITNFHLPKSTLLMLVSSIVGREKTLQLYREAIQKRYRFFSYGDAMLILR